jgi:TonB family protein
METVVKPAPADELHLLTEWGDPADGPRRRRAGILSVLLHAVVVMVFAALPASVLSPPRLPLIDRIVTPLVAPLTEMTQTAPNTGKVNKEFDAVRVEPRPRIQIPSAPPSTTKPRTLQPIDLPAPPVRTAQAPPEPPKVETPAARAPELPQQLARAAAPQIQTEEKPKLAFETPRAQAAPEPGMGRPLPRATDAIRGRLPGTAPGEAGEGPGGIGQTINLPPSPGMQPNNMQLLSDPMGVDFRPYLTQVLAAVKRYWMAVWPESARMGRSGRVAIQFSIDKSGGVPKLVIASPSGVNSLDRAAVAAISGSIPFAPLPTAFRGELIKLQLNFAYNIPQ